MDDEVLRGIQDECRKNGDSIIVYYKEKKKPVGEIMACATINEQIAAIAAVLYALKRSTGFHEMHILSLALEKLKNGEIHE